jgi:phage tail tube protein FII
VKPAPLRSGLLLDKSGMDSLDTEVDEDAEEAWRVEIRRRLEEIDRGAAKLVP